jgi:hypothetical protein
MRQADRTDPTVSLARAVWRILRRRTRLADPRISYKELAVTLREAADEFDFVTARSRQLYAALCVVGAACRRLGLPCLAALVVRADSRRPGAAYFDGAAPRGEQVAAWRDEVEAVRASSYPSEPPGREAS